MSGNAYLQQSSEIFVVFQASDPKQALQPTLQVLANGIVTAQKDSINRLD